jgi:magnesium transporter
MQEKTAPIYADDATERVELLLRLRLPWLVVGLVGGIVTTLFIGQFENLLVEQVQLAFFIPIIVYLSDAIGTQTEDIYIRNLARKRIRFIKYFTKELFLGLIFGLIFGFSVGTFAYVWLQNIHVATSVGVAMFLSASVATIIALVIPTVFYEEKADPATGAGPIKTVIQDFVSLLIYFLVSVVVIF